MVDETTANTDKQGVASPDDIDFSNIREMDTAEFINKYGKYVFEEDGMYFIKSKGKKVLILRRFQTWTEGLLVDGISMYVQFEKDFKDSIYDEVTFDDCFELMTTKNVNQVKRRTNKIGGCPNCGFRFVYHGRNKKYCSKECYLLKIGNKDAWKRYRIKEKAAERKNRNELVEMGFWPWRLTLIFNKLNRIDNY
jgi:endogenous inhibitor of DNA gyrase (YacG/DUF329 family)